MEEVEGWWEKASKHGFFLAELGHVRAPGELFELEIEAKKD